MGDPISISSGIAGLVALGITVTDTVYSYLHAVKDKSKNAKELQDELVLLGEVMSKLQYFLVSTPATANEFDKPDSVLSKAISACTERIERIGEKLKPKDSKVARAVDRLVWPFKEEEIARLMDALRRYRSTIEFAADIEGYKILCNTATDAKAGLEKAEEASKQMQELLAMRGMDLKYATQQSARIEQMLTLLPLLEATSKDVGEVSHAMRLQELREQERRKTEILDWLCPIADLHKHKDVQSRRAKDTGKWLLETTEYTSWMADAHQNLFCVGNPGVGKSVLASLVVDELKARYQDDSEVCVVHYYFDYSEQQLQTDTHFARSILRQVCVPTARVPEAVSIFYQKTRDVDKDRTWFQQLQAVVRRVLSTFTKCYLILDAVDETEAVKQRTALFDVIDSLRADQSAIKILATHRPHVSYVSKQFPQSASLHITAHPDDLRQYLSYIVDTHPDSEDIMDDILKHEVVDKLVDTAGGMFLLPSLHIKNILEQPTRADVRDVLKTLSTDLSIVFESTIARIRRLPIRSQEIACQALMWVSHARRRLSMEELRHALAVRFEDSELDKDRRVNSRRIIDACCGLIEHEPGSDVVHLVHYTLEEYLQAHDHKLFFNPDLSMLRVCLKYLTFESLRQIPSKNRRAAEEIISDMAFSQYACDEWGHHAQGLDPEGYIDLALPILESSRNLLTIARIRDAKTPVLRKWSERMSVWADESNGGAGISLAAGFGLTELVRVLISHHAQPNLVARNNFGSTPLHEAALYGHEETAELLISHGADIYDVNRGRATPFFLAVSYGCLNMARCLLKYGNKQTLLNAHCRGGATALHKAVELDSEIMVQYLLSSGAIIDAQTDSGDTPLHTAALRGSLKIVKMLILAGAQVEAENRIKETPLDLASTKGNTDIVKFLIQNRANVLHKAKDQWSVLHRAARGGHVDVVFVLLEHGADLLDEDPRRHIPIHHAARAGHLETVMQLIAYSPELSEDQLFQMNNRGSTARDVAFFCAHYDVCKYLRALEWELLGSATSINNKVTVAIENGEKAYLEKLLDTGQAGLETPDEDGQPPLHVAIQEAQYDIARMLLDRGASIEKVGYHGWRPLHVAASLGDLQMIDMCIQKGADIHSRTSTGQQPIHKAASSKSLAAIRQLIRVGADIEAKTRDGMSPLLIAAHKNAIDTVRALVLEYHADVLVRDKNGWTATMWAGKAHYFEVEKFMRIQQQQAKDRRKGTLRRAGTSTSDLRESKESLVPDEDSSMEESSMGKEPEILLA